jgi:hypothetical protein
MVNVVLPQEKEESDETLALHGNDGEHHRRKNILFLVKQRSFIFLLAMFGICMFLAKNIPYKNEQEKLPTHSNKIYNLIEKDEVSLPPRNNPSSISTWQEYLDVRSRCDWKPYSSSKVSDFELLMFNPVPEDGINRTREITSTSCTVQHSENSWLGVFRLNYGEIIPGFHYVLNNNRGKFLAQPAPLDFEPLWKEVNKTMISNKDLNSYLTAAVMWPMVRDDANPELQIASYPPIHMHHGKILGAGGQISNFNLAYTADSYCIEREDHCIWISLPEDHGFVWEQGLNLNILNYVETMTPLQCPLEPFPSSSELILEIAVVLTLAPKMKEVMVPVYLKTFLPPGDPTDMENEVNERVFAEGVMTAPVDRNIMQWSSMKFPNTGRIVPNDIDGYVRMHAHTAHISSIFLFRASPLDLGLNQGPFLRKTNKHKHQVPILLGDKSLDGNGYTIQEAKAYVLGHVVNGVDASEAINEISVDSDSVESQWESISSSMPSISNSKRLMCVWTGPSVVYTNCDESSPLSEGFDRRLRMHVPPGGNCTADLEAGDMFTWVFFNSKSKVGSVHHHAFFGPIIAGNNML